MQRVDKWCDLCQKVTEHLEIKLGRFAVTVWLCTVCDPLGKCPICSGQ